MATLDELREQIDEIDSKLVVLLNRRAELALQVKETKQKDKMSVYSPARERQILDRVKSMSEQGVFPQAPLERIFGNIISATRSLVGDISVAYVGPEYSLEHDAAVKQFGEEVQFSPEASAEDVFAKVERGDVHYGIIPARTSSAGIVTKTFDLLMQSKLRIIAEIELKERLALLTRARGVSDIRRVYSSAYYLSRCDSWLKANLAQAELVLESNVTGAVRYLEEHTDTALVATEATGERCGLVALATGIESDPGMDARCIVIGEKVPAPTGNDKTSLLCSVRDRAGALRDILRPFAERGITLLKIESRPMRNRAWEYVFFIDVVGHQSETLLEEAIGELSGLSTYLNVLGSYPMVCHS